MIPGLEAVSLEEEIATAYELAMSALKRGDAESANEHWRKFTVLHAQRSAQTVEFIEREKGLC